jgi:hypothetical protein
MDKVFCATVWNSTAKDQREFALSKGKSPKQIHTAGEQGESFETCANSFRSGGTLGLVGGLYILGQDSKSLNERLAVLREKNITPYDLKTGEKDGAKLYGLAMKSILGNKKFKGNKKKHKQLSAKGGQGKGKSMEEKRDGIAVDWLLRNIANSPHLTWAQKVEMLGGTISEGTLRRKYYEKQ